MTAFPVLTELQAQIGESNRAHGFRQYRDDLDSVSPFVDGMVNEALFQSRNNALQREQGNALMLIVSEAAEALEELRDGRAANKTYYPDGHNAEDSMGNLNGPWVKAGKPEGVPSEIADIVIRCLDFADANGFDLGDILAEKIAYNTGRPFKHGREF